MLLQFLIVSAMVLGSAPVFSAPPIHKQHKQVNEIISIVVQKSNVGTWNKQIQTFAARTRNKWRVSCRQVKIEEESINDEACELVNGTELTIGLTRAQLFTAVKNNNATGILLLSDILGFQDSATTDFAYRLACNGYNVLVPDLFNGDSWTKDRPSALLEQWITKHSPESVAKTVFASAEWMLNEFAELGISNKLGIIGFCYGGGRVIDVLAQDQGAVFGSGVSFYGTKINSSVAENINVPLLLITGKNDKLCHFKILEDVAKRNEKLKLVVFLERDHGFAHRPQTQEEDVDAEEAFTIMRNWLHDGLIVNS